MNPMKRFFLMLTIVLGVSFMALAAEDPAGTWKGTMETPMGSQGNTFVLKVDGGKLTGTLSHDMMGSRQISDGKIDGERISFSVNSDFGIITYSGTVKGDTLKPTITAGDGQFTLDINATRVKSQATGA
jgi:hypothetical protein